MEASDDEADAENKAQSNDEMTPQQQQKQNQSTGRRGRPPKRPRPSQESASSPPSTISESGDKTSNQSTGQMMMDTDVMVDYDPPAMYSMAAMMQNKIKSKGLSMTIEPKQPSKEDISLLRGNPNISMRELFPGEEEMGLQVNIPFNSGGQRTPEGWTKIMTTIQYDEPTRHLWEELQKPYGNQSSFLRHLILLEKYFRNGELVLTPGATYNAVNYSESVQQRLQSFDSRCTSNYSLNNPYKMSNPPVSIFPTTKAKPKPSATETTSLLKYSSSEQQRQEAQLAKQRKVQQQQQIQQQQLAKAQAAKREQLLASSLRTAKPEEQTKTPKQGGIPPELISINSTKQLTAATTASNSQAQTQQQQQTPNHSKSTKQSESNSLLIPSTSSSGQKKSSNSSKSASQTNIIRLPDILSPAERLESNKWRPTLMPVSAGPPALDGQLYQSADGRKLPNLVQVQSGGKPYLISIHDYNRMCIMRRERLLREQMIERQQQAQQNIANQQQQALANQSLIQKMQQQQSTAQLNATQQPSVSIHSTPKPMTTSNAEESSNKLSMSITQIPNKILEQNSVIPLNSKSSTLDSLLKVRKTNSASLLKPNLQTSTATKPSHTITTMNQQNVISITSTPSISAILGSQPISLGNAPSTSKSPITTSSSSSSSSALDALMKTTQQATQSNMWSWAETLNSNGSVVIDNSAATLLSKIPKSLTVIPQQKSRSSKSSSEDWKRVGFLCA